MSNIYKSWLLDFILIYTYHLQLLCKWNFEGFQFILSLLDIYLENHVNFTYKNKLNFLIFIFFKDALISNLLVKKYNFL